MLKKFFKALKSMIVNGYLRLLTRFKFSESVKISGTVRLIGSNYDKNGVLRQVFDRKLRNLITDAGFDLIADTLAKNAQPSDLTHLAIGDGAVGGTSDTALTNETDRQTATYAHTPGTKTFTLTATFSNVIAVTEYGAFNDGSVGSMWNTAGFTAITVDSLELILTGTLS